MIVRTDFPLVLNVLAEAIIEHLGGSLIGLYLYGSLVVGDFDDERSDIDLLAVTREPLGPEAERSIAQMHDSIVQRFPEWQDRLEVGYFPLAVVSDFEGPLGDVHRISPGEPFHQTPALPHWLTDLYSVQEHGHALYGPASVEVVAPVSPARFRATIQRLVADWRDLVVGVEEQRHQSYVRLTMFRSLYAYQYARQTSKVAAATWFSADFPEWSREAQEAVLWRQGDSTAIDPIGAKRTEDLVRFVYRRTRA